MNPCAICSAPIDGPALTDAGARFHPACAIARAPADALDLLLGYALLFLAPAAYVWAA